MKCHKAQQWLSQALDGELDADRKARLSEHLANCPACRSVQAAWQDAAARLRRESMEIPPAEVMWADVRRAIHQAQPEPVPAWTQGRLRWAAAVLGLVLLGLGIWGTLQPAGLNQVALGAVAAEPVVEWAEAELPGASTLVYEDAETDTVVIWLMTADTGAEAPKGT